MGITLQDAARAGQCARPGIALRSAVRQAPRRGRGRRCAVVLTGTGPRCSRRRGPETAGGRRPRLSRRAPALSDCFARLFFHPRPVLSRCQRSAPSRVAACWPAPPTGGWAPAAPPHRRRRAAGKGDPLPRHPRAGDRHAMGGGPGLPQRWSDSEADLGHAADAQGSAGSGSAPSSDPGTPWWTRAVKEAEALAALPAASFHLHPGPRRASPSVITLAPRGAHRSRGGADLGAPRPHRTRSGAQAVCGFTGGPPATSAWREQPSPRAGRMPGHAGRTPSARWRTPSARRAHAGRTPSAMPGHTEARRAHRLARRAHAGRTVDKPAPLLSSPGTRPSQTSDHPAKESRMVPRSGPSQSVTCVRAGAVSRRCPRRPPPPSARPSPSRFAAHPEGLNEEARNGTRDGQSGLAIASDERTIHKVPDPFP